MSLIEVESAQKEFAKFRIRAMAACDDGVNEMVKFHDPSSFLSGLDYCVERLNELIHNQPTVDAVPVVRGEWVGVEFDMFYECSKCGYSTDYRLSNFCPNCGADMRGEK